MKQDRKEKNLRSVLKQYIEEIRGKKLEISPETIYRGKKPEISPETIYRGKKPEISPETIYRGKKT